MMIRPCRPDDFVAIHEIINDAAEAYRGVIPADCWHEPYMPRDELGREVGDRFGPAGKDRLLRRYWTVLPRQTEESVVLLADGRWLETVDRAGVRD